MQAIMTKYLSPTNHRGARVVAKCDAGRIVVSWDHALGPEQNHAKAAKMLADKLGWHGSWHGGGIGGGYVYVQTDRANSVAACETLIKGDLQIAIDLARAALAKAGES